MAKKNHIITYYNHHKQRLPEISVNDQVIVQNIQTKQGPAGKTETIHDHTYRPS